MKYATGFPNATTLASGDVFQLVQGPLDKQCSLNTLLSYVNTNATGFVTTSAFNTFKTSDYNIHAPTHLLGGSNELDVMKTRVSNLVVTITPDGGWTGGGSVNHLGAYMKAFDTKINNNSIILSAHAGQHSELSIDPILGLYLDGSSFAPTFYTPITWGVGTTSTSIGGQFAGINTKFGTVDAAIALKAPLLNPTFTGVVLVPDLITATDNSQAANTKFVHDIKDEIIGGATAGYDTLGEIEATLTTGLSAKAPIVHALRHQTGGADPIIGTRTASDFSASNYVPTIYYGGGTVNEIGAHLNGINTAIGSLSSLKKAIFTYAAGGPVGIVSTGVDVDLQFSNTGYSSGFTNNTTHIAVNSPMLVRVAWHLGLRVGTPSSDSYQLQLFSNAGAVAGTIMLNTGGADMPNHISGEYYELAPAGRTYSLRIRNTSTNVDIDLESGQFIIEQL